MAFYCPSILQEFECPVCIEYMHSPIRQCETGHSICDKCFVLLQVCPICRSPKGRARNLALEHIQARIAFPCRNRGDGCRFVDLGAHILDHEVHCLYNPISCLLKTSTNCNWKGALRSFVFHCNIQHADRVYAANEDTITCVDFAKSEELNQNSSNAIIVAADASEVFKCVWHVNHETDLMRWGLFYVGLERSPKDFLFEIVVENYGQDEEELTMKGACKHFKQEKNSFAKNLCLFTNYEMLKKFCDGNDLKYRVNIFENRPLKCE